jgi:hypothetical protein
LHFATADLEYIIKTQPTTVKDFIESYASDNGMTVKNCYAILAKLKSFKLVKYDRDFKVYNYDSNRYFKDLTALKAFHQQVRKWNENTICRP